MVHFKNALSGINCKENYNSYGTRRIKKKLGSEGIHISRRRISQIMASEGLVSTYTVSNFKPESSPINNDNVSNEANRNFDDKEKLEVIVSDLIYVKVGGRWNYICTIVDLHNREILASCCGPQKKCRISKVNFCKNKRELETHKILSHRSR